jgi:hypothetical protein
MGIITLVGPPCVFGGRTGRLQIEKRKLQIKEDSIYTPIIIFISKLQQ